jgi:hypothetical protein
MHDHQYKAPNIPDPQRANILFRFNKSVRVADLVIIQHSNGVAEVEGWVGDSKDNMRSIGTATSSLAQAALGLNVFNNGARDVFTFKQSGEGKFLRVVITKTSLPNGYAFFRMYPRNSSRKPFQALRLDDLAENQ